MTLPATPTPASDPEFDRFYLEYFLPLVRRAIRRHGLSTEDAHDVVQDAFILGLKKLDGSKNPKAWLYQVVDHLAANFSRKATRRSRLMAYWNAPDRPSILRARFGEGMPDDL
ncbi:MAG: sigma-70 family RNA polymerase sigma factor [Acidobacteriota bacterium]